MKLGLLILSILISSLSFAQEKREYESRIDAEDFPEEAYQVISTVREDVRRLKFYKEVDGTAESFEAKFKFEGKRHSVEFNANGKLEDVEVRISKSKLPKTLLNSIESYLDNTYERWKIEKIQAQFLRKKSALKTLERAMAFNSLASENYELIVATKQDGKLKKYEFLFNSKGKLLNKRDIVRRSYDFLLF